MSGPTDQLCDRKRALLQQFKENVKDISKDLFDDHYFLRWLRARNFDLKKSEAMLRNHMRWREQHRVDEILREFVAPEVMDRFSTGGQFGQDREGALVFIDPFGYLDMKGLLMSVKKQVLVQSKIWLLEEMYRLFELKTKEQGRRVDKMVIIIDLENFGMRHLWKPGIDILTQMVTMFEDHYPETLKTTYVINAPKIFPMAYSLVKPFLSEATHNKIKICGTDYKDCLLQNMDPAQLPVQWGGVCTDPDGNPRCPSVIKPGGDVPKSYYFDRELTLDLSEFKEVTVGTGSSLQLAFNDLKAGSLIRWQFLTDGFDIGFGVFRKTGKGQQRASDMELVLPSQRVNSHMVPEDGTFQCREAGDYVLRFDNTYSWTRSKKVRYQVELISPEAGGPRERLDQGQMDEAGGAGPYESH